MEQVFILEMEMLVEHLPVKIKIGMVGINIPIPVPVAFHSFWWMEKIFVWRSTHAWGRGCKILYQT